LNSEKFIVISFLHRFRRDKRQTTLNHENENSSKKKLTIGVLLIKFDLPKLNFYMDSKNITSFIYEEKYKIFVIKFKKLFYFKIK
jgi:hypothetical protein